MLVPALTHWNHPGFFAYFASSGSAPGVLAEFLAAALNQQAMLWRTSPAATELEEVATSWLGDLMGLPEDFEGVIYDTASMSTLHALAAGQRGLEEGEAPDRIIAARLKDYNHMQPIIFPIERRRVQMTRPIYPYPIRAMYNGSGNPDSADSYYPFPLN